MGTQEAGTLVGCGLGVVRHELWLVAVCSGLRVRVSKKCIQSAVRIGLLSNTKRTIKVLRTDSRRIVARSRARRDATFLHVSCGPHRPTSLCNA